MQYTPDIDMVRTLNVEHEVWIARQRPCAQTRQVEFMGVAWRTCGRVATDVPVSLLQRIDEAHCHGFARLTQVVGDGLVHIPICLLTRDDWLGLHDLAAGLAALRTRSRSPSK